MTSGSIAAPAHDAPTRVVVAGGSGLIGRAVTASLCRDGVAVDVLTRNPGRTDRRLPTGVRAVGWDPADSRGEEALARVLAGADAVVNTSGVPVGPLPWTAGRKRAIVASRVGTNERLVAAIARLPAAERPRVLVSAAGTDGYTGLDATPATEATPTDTVPGFLAQLGRDWEAAALPAEDLGVRVALVRTAIVIDRDAALLRLIALPFRLFVGGRWGNGAQWFSWIHLDDLVAVYRRAIDDDGLRGPINAAAPQPCRQRDLAAALGRALHRPSWLPVPAWTLRLVLREQAGLLLGSRRVAPARLASAGFAFRHPTLDGALRDAFGPRDRR